MSKVCYFFNNGHCRNGEQCQFMHIIVPPPVCHYFRIGTCRYGSSCRNLHPNTMQLIIPNQQIDTKITTTKALSIKSTLYLCLLRKNVPPELIDMIHSYMKYKRLDDDTIQTAVNQYNSIPEQVKFLYGPIAYWDTSQVTDMSKLFKNAPTFNEDIHRWDVSNVKNMSGMFEGAHSFNQPIGCWDVSNVTNMSNMFLRATTFNQPVEDWNVSKVNWMSNMFRDAPQFNQPVERWDVRNVYDIGFMFYGASSFNQPLNGWVVRRDVFVGYLFDRRNTAFTHSVDSWDVVDREALRIFLFGRRD